MAVNNDALCSDEILVTVASTIPRKVRYVAGHPVEGVSKLIE